MADPFLRFTEEALKAQDGKKVPVTDRPGGKVIGEATMKYVEGEGLHADYRIDDPKMAEMLGDSLSSVIFKSEKEN